MQITVSIQNDTSTPNGAVDARAAVAALVASLPENTRWSAVASENGEILDRWSYLSVEEEDEGDTSWSMYTDAGDQAVEAVMSTITPELVASLPFQALEAQLRARLQEVQALHPEITDTEPRGMIAAHVAECAKQIRGLDAEVYLEGEYI